MIGTTEVTGEVTFSIDNTELAEIIPQETNNICVVHANKKNKLGSIVLTATYDNKEYSKTIKIIPLW